MKTEFDRLQTDFAWSHHIYVPQSQARRNEFSIGAASQG